MTVFAVLAPSALAAGPEVWAALYDGRLAQAADRDPAAAASIYETVLAHLDAGDPIRPELAWWLGRARYEAGDTAGAASAMQEVEGDPALRARAREFRGRIDLLDRRVSSLPYKTGFEVGPEPWVRDWERGDPSDLQVVSGVGPGGAALGWRTDARGGGSDDLMADLASAGRAPQRIRLFVRAEVPPAWVRLVLVESDGRRWTSPVQEVGGEAWTAIDVAVAAFRPDLESTSKSVAIADAVDHLRLEDVSAFHGAPRGRNTLFVDDLEIR